MRYDRKISLLLMAALCWVMAPTAQSQSTGSCEQSIGESFLDINNVRARILNNGNLFWRGSPHVYNVPKGGPANANFASGIWLGGLVDGQLRLAGSTYGPYEFWAGPLDDAGAPPADCGAFDRVWRVSKEDVVAFEGTGISTPDLQDWPTGLGAPTLDANGELIDVLDQPLASRVDRKINLAAGERPAILGDQMLWWIMNDRGNVHQRTDAPPMGVEVHGTAFAFNTAGAIGNTTFYKYKIIYKGSVPLVQTYMGIFDDPDLGNFDDDYVGSDTTLGMGYVYNADNEDEGGEGYGSPVPALGYDFFQGPLVNDDGLDNNGNGQVDEDNERLKMTSFVFYNNGGGVQGDPRDAIDMYNYMQARWRDGQRITFGGDGRNFSSIPTNFMYTGNPPNFWSEFNSDGAGTAIAPADRRFVMASGPFTLNPGGEQDIVFGIVWSLGSDNLNSVQKMKADDALAQAVFDIDFQLPAPPAAPRVTATELDGKVIIEWGYNPTDNNYLDSYEVIDPLLSSDVTDNDYQFEGYNVFQFADQQDQDGKLIAVYDKINGVTRVIEGAELTFVTAEGNDNGIQHSHVVDGLTNYQTYFFGVQAYAYNAASNPKAYKGPIRRFSATPTRIDARNGGTRINTERGVDFVGELKAGASDGAAAARIVNPAEVTGHEYEISFVNVEVPGSDPDHPEVVTAWTITDATTGEVKVDGRETVAQTGKAPEQRENLVVVDGLEFDITGPPPAFKWFYVTANAAGPLDPWTGGAADFGDYPVPNRPGDEQQATNNSVWFFHTGGGRSSFSEFIGRVARNDNFSRIVPYDWEQRFDGTSTCNRAFQDGLLVEVPATFWRAGVATPDDRSDDVRLTCWILEGFGGGTDEFVYDIGDDSPLSGSDNDPYTDWIYWILPTDQSAGEAGYLADEAAMLDGSYDFSGDEVLARTVLVSWNGGTAPPYDAPLPEQGTIFRIESTKPNVPGVVFGINTAGHAVETGVTEVAKDALKEIGIVPNPYKGSSAYEVSQLVDQVRFTNMPQQATIRVFTLNGTLIRTLVKNSPEQVFAWDLTTEDNLPIASGMYLIHVEVPGLGERVLKFFVVKKRIQLNTF